MRAKKKLKFLSKLKNKSTYLTRHLFLGIIFIYQYIFSPLLNIIFGVYSKCRSNPSCSEYSKICFIKYSFIKAISLTFIRFIKCHPFF